MRNVLLVLGLVILGYCTFLIYERHTNPIPQFTEEECQMIVREEGI